MTLTMVGTELAREGASFVYLGPVLECEQCQFAKLCLGLKAGAAYKVTAVRKVRHPCDATEAEAAVVEVEEVDRSLGAEKKSALDGATVTFAPAGCGRVDCPRYAECNPVGLEDGGKVSLVEVGKRLDCPAGLDRVSARVRVLRTCRTPAVSPQSRRS